MTFKLIGAVFVIVASSLIGYKKGESYVIRTQVIGDIITMLRSIKNNILYKKDTTAKAIYSALLCENLRYISFTIDEDSSPEFPMLLKKSLESAELSIGQYLSTQEKSVFVETLCKLGSSNAKEEVEKLQFAEIYFDELHKKAKEEAKVHLKLYKSLGVAAGAGLVILFL